jgi:murein DD-endopeptidase MepM/ murein hydrolase activator NlpD
MYQGELVKDFHKGWDIGLPEGSRIELPEPAQLVDGFDKAFGNFVVAKGEAYRWNFWHLQTPTRLVEAHEYFFPKGTILGHSGNSGMSTAPHCHMQIAKLGDPSGSYIDPFEVFTDEVIDSLEFPPGTIRKVADVSQLPPPKIQFEYSETDSYSNLIDRVDDLLNDITNVRDQAETIKELLGKERG